MTDMSGTYAYSLNGENYTGVYATRKEALAAALEKARNASDTPTTVYVGQRVPADPQAAGHADPIINRMRERAAAEGDSTYLAAATEHDAADLDTAVETAILGWLKQHKFVSSRFTVAAISEHTVPLPMGSGFRGDGSEVHELGVNENLSPPEM